MNTFRKINLGVIVLCGLIPIAGCVATQKEVVEDRARIAALEAVTEEIELDQKSQRDSLKYEIAQADVQINRLRQVIDETQAIFGQNTADLGIRTQEIIEKYQQLMGEIELTQQRLAMLEKKLDTMETSSVAASVTKTENGQDAAIEKTPLAEIERPKDEKEFYQLIVKIWKSERYDDAIMLAREFLLKWGQSALTPLVRFSIGEILLDQRKYQAAISAYRTVLEMHPKSDQVPPSLYKLGVCFASIDMRNEAKVFFLEVKNKYPNTPYAKKASEQLAKLAEIEKSMKESKTVPAPQKQSGKQKKK